MFLGAGLSDFRGSPCPPLPSVGSHVMYLRSWTGRTVVISSALMALMALMTRPAVNVPCYPPVLLTNAPEPIGEGSLSVA